MKAQAPDEWCHRLLAMLVHPLGDGGHEAVMELLIQGNRTRAKVVVTPQVMTIFCARPSAGASAHTTDPAVKKPSPTKNTRGRPDTSAMRPAASKRAAKQSIQDLVAESGQDLARGMPTQAESRSKRSARVWTTTSARRRPLPRCTI